MARENICPWPENRASVIRPDVPEGLNVGDLILVGSGDGRAWKHHRIDELVAAECQRPLEERWPDWLAPPPDYDLATRAASEVQEQPPSE
jgi:hypothetical protein